MTMRAVSLEAGEAVELGELLQFLVGWLDSDGDRLSASLSRFVGSDGYGIYGLCADLSRFAFLLGGSDGDEMQLGGDGR